MALTAGCCVKACSPAVLCPDMVAVPMAVQLQRFPPVGNPDTKISVRWIESAITRGLCLLSVCLRDIVSIYPASLSSSHSPSTMRLPACHIAVFGLSCHAYIVVLSHKATSGNVICGCMYNAAIMRSLKQRRAPMLRAKRSSKLWNQTLSPSEKLY